MKKVNLFSGFHVETAESQVKLMEVHFHAWHRGDSEDSNKEKGRERARRKTVANTTTGKHNMKWNLGDTF